MWGGHFPQSSVLVSDLKLTHFLSQIYLSFRAHVTPRGWPVFTQSACVVTLPCLRKDVSCVYLSKLRSACDDTVEWCETSQLSFHLPIYSISTEPRLKCSPCKAIAALNGTAIEMYRVEIYCDYADGKVTANWDLGVPVFPDHFT